MVCSVKIAADLTNVRIWALEKKPKVGNLKKGKFADSQRQIQKGDTNKILPHFCTLAHIKRQKRKNLTRVNICCFY